VSAELVTIPARGGKAAQAGAGQHIKVVNTHGTQVVDAWAFNARDLTEWMSMEASRASFITRGGGGDTLSPTSEAVSPSSRTRAVRPRHVDGALDRWRYGLLGVGAIDNCRDNLHSAFANLGVVIRARRRR
jgi:hypothetical protein